MRFDKYATQSPEPGSPPLLLATPPRGVALAAWVLLFLWMGSIGHDPWKGDDATHFGVVWSMLQSGFEWVPHLAGEPYLEYPPLYYWASTSLAHLLGWLLPAPDCVRLTSGIFIAAYLFLLAQTAQRWHGEVAAAPTALLALGSLGLMVHAHEAQPMTAIIAMTSLGFYGFAVMDRHPLMGAFVAGTGQAALFLSGGLVASLALLPVWLLAPLAVPSLRTRAGGYALTGGFLFACLIAGVFVFALQAMAPKLFGTWVAQEVQKFSPAFTAWPSLLQDWGKMIPWFTWPVLPFALWAVWQQRRHFASPAIRLPLLFMLCALGVLLFSTPRSAAALPLIAPLALLAGGGLPMLRRGAANAFDWFGIMTFSLLGAFVWFAWFTLAGGSPARFAHTLERLAPNFNFQFSFPALVVALTLSMLWVWLLLNSPRSPFRGVTHWAAGVIMFWGLTASLLFPWVDYTKSYRPVVESLQRRLQTLPAGCIASRDLSPSQRASLDYFANLLTRHTAGAENECKLLLIQSSRQHPGATPSAPWTLRWEGQRPSDRNEIFRLYVRD